MAVSPLWMIFYFCLSATKINEAQRCLRTGNGNGLPFLQNSSSDIFDNGGILGRRQQALIISYKFDCDLMCGNITEWGVDLHPGGNANDMEYTLDLQVWRPSPTVDDSAGTGCYSLVGNNRFTLISLSNQVAVVTPLPQDYIEFQPGDVLGFYVEEARDATDGVAILTSPSSFTSELVWHASIAPTKVTSQNGDCPYSIGSSGVLNTLTRAAPVISISTATFSCPSLSTATTQPIPPPNPTIHPPILRPSEPTDIELINGIGSVVAIAVIIVTLSAVIAAAVLLKKHGKIKKDFTSSNIPTTTNQVYGLTHHIEREEESIYNYPEVNLENTIEAKQNAAYVSNTGIIT